MLREGFAKKRQVGIYAKLYLVYKRNLNGDEKKIFLAFMLNPGIAR